MLGVNVGLERHRHGGCGTSGGFPANSGPLGANYGFTTTLLPNGKTLIAGGTLQTTIPTKKDYVFSSADLFDPVTRSGRKLVR